LAQRNCGTRLEFGCRRKFQSTSLSRLGADPDERAQIEGGDISSTSSQQTGIDGLSRRHVFLCVVLHGKRTCSVANLPKLGDSSSCVGMYVRVERAESDVHELDLAQRSHSDDSHEDRKPNKGCGTCCAWYGNSCEEKNAEYRLDCACSGLNVEPN